MQIGKRKAIILHAAFGAAALVPTLTQAATWTWIGSGGSAGSPATGSWNASGNWSSGNIPSDSSATVLIFGGSGSTPYTATNNFTDHDASVLRLNSSSTATHTIAGNQMEDGFSRSVEQLNSGAFNISMPFNQQNNTLTLTGNGTGVVTLSGLLSGDFLQPLTLTKSGTSTYVVNGDNGITWGSVNAQAGILRFAASNSIGNFFGNSVTVSSGAVVAMDSSFDISGDIAASSTGIIALNSNNSALSGVAGSSAFVGSLGTFTLTRTTGNFAAGSGNRYRLGGGGGALTIANANTLTGSNGLTVGSSQTNGSGIVVLSAANNYTGTTIIDAGKLLVNGTGGTGSNTVTVNSGATLGGTGTISGATTVSGSGSGGTLAPGASVGKLTFTADITLQNNSFLEIELGAPTTAGVTYDQVEVRGSGSEFTLGGAKLKLIGLPGLSPGTYTIINGAASGVVADAMLRNLDGTAMDDNVTTYSQAGISFKVDYSSGGVNLVVSAVPEPSTLGLAMLAAPALLRRRRRA